MKCYYEVLEVDEDASDEDIKKSYRRLALRWHPDKNLETADEAKEMFQLVQQAYDVLSDPQERSWYDRHKDSILKGGLGENYQDDSLNVYAYFTTSCYKGFNDDENGFYSVYNEVFKTIAAEDSEFCTDDVEIPEFGDSKSPYLEVVHLFYSHWQSYSTKKTFSWLDEYDIRQAPNRRVVRLMEKENKKIRDKARKERNEEVRALVNFVRKRDKRVQEYSKLLEQKSLENEKKANEMRKKQILEKNEKMKSYVESDWSKFTNVLDELEQIESQLTVEDEEEESLYCTACNKLFKTTKAFHNHEKSKKHQENSKLLMQNGDEDEDENDDDLLDGEEDLDDISISTEDEEIKTKKKKEKKKKAFMPELDNSDVDLSLEEIERQRNEKKTVEPVKKPAKVKKKDKEKKKAKEENPEEEVKKNLCVTCNEEFPSKNALFKHLKSSGHAVYLPEATDNKKSSKSKKK
ncbi:dnaJ homolog subfamily C member 21 [Cimex lectularius]|uniref:DnaJ homolog subfamily C member 21 n=1 Tax=Cimex lectularius TaxID=79782 RepID=A0A8I6S550_CIMLE|nr:dnaJ homolog subfamily C member 21 [Cimex lectularius]